MGSVSSAFVCEKTYSLERGMTPIFLCNQKVVLTELERRTVLSRPIEAEVEEEQGMVDRWVKR